MSWYDNEIGYPTRVLDLIAHMYSVDHKQGNSLRVLKSYKNASRSYRAEAFFALLA